MDWAVRHNLPPGRARPPRPGPPGRASPPHAPRPTRQ